MISLRSGAAVVTGSSGGIGRAVAAALAAQGLSLCLTGRDPGRLQEAARECGAGGAPVLVHRANLSFDDEIRGLVERVGAEVGRLDVLVHAAGTLRLGNIEVAGWDDLDEQYRVNLRAPILLTKAFLPLLKRSQGQVVFISSAAGLRASADNGVYAATKHALGWLAGSIRDHVNPYGVRVLTVFPGRTATPLQEALHELEGRRYLAADLLQPSDIAAVVVAALALPRTAEVTDIALRPMKKPSPGRRGP